MVIRDDPVGSASTGGRHERATRSCCSNGGTGAAGTAMTFHVDSEVGRLKQVLLHKPELALKRLTPSNKDELLFDDVLWVQRALEEHEACQQVIRDRGIKVHMLSDLLVETLAIPEAKKHILDSIIDERWFGPLATDAIRNALDAMNAVTLAPFMTGGITTRE